MPFRVRRSEQAPVAGMVKAEDLTKVRRAEAAPVATAAPADPALAARRERLVERMALMQMELGGAFYEMAIRDHVQIDALMARAAELQRVDSELAHVDELIGLGRQAPGGVCSQCESPHGRGAAFCWNCGASLAPAEGDADAA